MAYEQYSDAELARIAGGGRAQIARPTAVPTPSLTNYSDADLEMISRGKEPTEEEMRAAVWAPHEAWQEMQALGEVKPTPSLGGKILREAKAPGEVLGSLVGGLAWLPGAVSGVVGNVIAGHKVGASWEEEVNAAMANLLPPTESESAKFILGQVGEAIKTALVPAERASEQVSKGSPDAGYTTKKVLEFLTFMLPGVAKGKMVARAGKDTPALAKLRESLAKESQISERTARIVEGRMAGGERPLRTLARKEGEITAQAAREAVEKEYAEKVFTDENLARTEKLATAQRRFEAPPEEGFVGPVQEPRVAPPTPEELAAFEAREPGGFKVDEGGKILTLDQSRLDTLKAEAAQKGGEFGEFFPGWPEGQPLRVAGEPLVVPEGGTMGPRDMTVRQVRARAKELGELPSPRAKVSEEIPPLPPVEGSPIPIPKPTAPARSGKGKGAETPKGKPAPTEGGGTPPTPSTPTPKVTLADVAKGMKTEDIAALLNEVDKSRGVETPKAPKAPRSAGAAAKSAAVHTGKAFKAGTDALNKILGGERGSVSNKPLPEDHYPLIKKTLQTMHDEAVLAGHDLRTFVNAVYDKVKGNIRPHMERFLNEMAGNKPKAPAKPQEAKPVTSAPSTYLQDLRGRLAEADQAFQKKVRDKSRPESIEKAKRHADNLRKQLGIMEKTAAKKVEKVVEKTKTPTKAQESTTTKGRGIEVVRLPFSSTSIPDGVVDGHRYKGKTILNAAPGERGALGNPFKAKDAGGSLTREEAVAKFKEVFLERVNKDPKYREWVESLRGKKIGYYKPDAISHHLQVVQEWLMGRSTSPTIVAATKVSNRGTLLREKVELERRIPEITQRTAKGRGMDALLHDKELGGISKEKPQGVKDIEARIREIDKELAKGGAPTRTEVLQSHLDYLTEKVNGIKESSNPTSAQRNLLRKLEREQDHYINKLNWANRERTGGTPKVKAQDKWVKGEPPVADVRAAITKAKEREAVPKKPPEAVKVAPIESSEWGGKVPPKEAPIPHDLKGLDTEIDTLRQATHTKRSAARLKDLLNQRSALSERLVREEKAVPPTKAVTVAPTRSEAIADFMEKYKASYEEAEMIIGRGPTPPTQRIPTKRGAERTPYEKEKAISGDEWAREVDEGNQTKIRAKREPSAVVVAKEKLRMDRLKKAADDAWGAQKQTTTEQARSTVKQLAKDMGVGESPTKMDAIWKALGTETGSSTLPIKAAALVIDTAKKAGKSVSDYMKEHKFSKEDIAAVVRIAGDVDSGKRKLADMVKSEEMVKNEFVKASKGIEAEIKKIKAEKDPVKKEYSKTNVLRYLEKHQVASLGKAIARETEAGAKMVEEVYKGYESGERLAGPLEADFWKSTKGLSDKEFDNYRKVLEGKEKAINPKVEGAAVEGRRILDEVKQAVLDFNAEAKAKGEPQITILRGSTGAKVEFTGRQSFFPHMLKRAALEKNIERAVDHLVKTGQAEKIDKVTGKIMDRAKQKEYARTLVNQYMRRATERRQGNLQVSRELNLPEEFWETDPRIAMPLYLANTSMRIAQAKMWGAKDQKLYAHVKKIGDQGGDIHLAQTALDRILSKDVHNEIADQVLRKVLGYQVITKMGLSAISQMTQEMSALVRTNGRSFAKATAFKRIHPEEAQDWFIRSGSGVRGVAQYARNELMGFASNPTDAFLQRTGFTHFDIKSRMKANLSGRFYAEYLSSKLAKNPNSTHTIRRLKQLDIDPVQLKKQGYMPTQEQLMRAAQKVEIDSNFRNRVLDLPEFWTSRFGRLVVQFNTFSYSQTRFLRDHVVKEAAHGNLMPLVYLLTAGEVLGESINQVRGFITGRQQSENVPRRLLDNLAAVGAIGLFDKALGMARYGDPPLGATLTTLWNAGKAGWAVGTGLYKGFTEDDDWESGLKDLGKSAEFPIGEFPAFGSRLKKEFKDWKDEGEGQERKDAARDYWSDHPWDLGGVMSNDIPAGERTNSLRSTRRSIRR